MYGHIYRMAKAAEAAVNDAGGEPILMRVEDVVPDKYLDEFAKQTRDTLKDVPVADPRKDLSGVDGLIVGTPTRYGNMTGQMRNFWDQTGGEWVKGTLIGKPAAVFTSSATQHGGQETTIITTMITLLHHGAIIVGLPYSNTEQMRIDEITGGSPYGASTIAGGKGERSPSDNELLLMARLAKRVVKIAMKLKKQSH
ncbi:MAG: NAD(P)H:quinone oxidoreductase [Candidatus Lokiarchaeota archaeon]|nr:NAD(P)H:quinone oxidoreductase [Candidatus Lokiarchaeota archaeon]